MGGKYLIFIPVMERMEKKNAELRIDEQEFKELRSWLEENLRGKFLAEGTGHDWWHIHRVRNCALQVGKREGANVQVVEIAALLHDIADHKFHNGDLKKGPQVARRWLSKREVDNGFIDSVTTIIEEVSFKGAGVETPVSSLEAACVQDADRLDAIGAIGIARAFAYGGHKNRPIYEPGVEVENHDSFEEYRLGGSHTINHFYEKLLLLKDRMQTETGRQYARKRHRYMEEYLERFYNEWEGKL